MGASPTASSNRGASSAAPSNGGASSAGSLFAGSSAEAAPPGRPSVGASALGAASSSGADARAGLGPNLAELALQAIARATNTGGPPPGPASGGRADRGLGAAAALIGVAAAVTPGADSLVATSASGAPGTARDTVDAPHRRGAPLGDPSDPRSPAPDRPAPAGTAFTSTDGIPANTFGAHRQLTTVAPQIDPAELASLLNETLVEQARIHGLDLS